MLRIRPRTTGPRADDRLGRWGSSHRDRKTPGTTAMTTISAAYRLAVAYETCDW
jgi:hypothetical protein